MAVVGKKVPSRAAVRYGILPFLAKSMAFDGEAVYRQIKQETILAAVQKFKTRDIFLATMDPIEPLMKDPVSRDFVIGVVEKFKEIESDCEHGMGWIHEEVPSGRVSKNVRH